MAFQRFGLVGLQLSKLEYKAYNFQVAPPDHSEFSLLSDHMPYGLQVCVSIPLSSTAHALGPLDTTSLQSFSFSCFVAGLIWISPHGLVVDTPHEATQNVLGRLTERVAIGTV